MTATKIPGTSVLDGSLTHADIAAANLDGTAATLSMRTLGAGPLQAFPGNRLSCFRQWIKNPNDTAFVNVGFVAGPTVTSSTAAATGDTATRPYLTVDTAATTNSVAKVVSAALNYVRRCFIPILNWPFRTGPSVATVSFWIGFTSASLDAVATPTTQHVAAFRYDTSVDGTAFWRCITCNGASGVTTTTTSVAVSTATEYNFRIEMDSSNVFFYIDNVLVGTHTTNLPGNTTNVGLVQSATTLANAAIQFRSATLSLLSA